MRADLFPRLNYAVDGAIEGTTGSDGETNSSALAVLNASYIVDLWGKVRRSNEAAVNELLATEEAYRSITIALEPGWTTHCRGVYGRNGQSLGCRGCSGSPHTVHGR